MAINIIKTYRNIGSESNPNMSGFVYETFAEAVRINENSDTNIKEYIDNVANSILQSPPPIL